MPRLQVLAVDNDSDDESLNFLQSLHWIDLIEREVKLSEQGQVAHSRALYGESEQANKQLRLNRFE